MNQEYEDKKGLYHSSLKVQYFRLTQDDDLNTPVL